VSDCSQDGGISELREGFHMIFVIFGDSIANICLVLKIA